MAFTDLQRATNLAALKAFLDKHRPPEHIRAELDIGYAITQHTVDIFEIRPQWDDKDIIRHYPVARIRFVKASGIWKLYWMRADLKWHRYETDSELMTLAVALREVGRDPHGCFFG
jgi:hypothetical protein